MEAPEYIEEMQQNCDEVGGYKVANVIEHGKTPVLPHQQLQTMGYKITVYPLTLTKVSIQAMQKSLSALKKGDKQKVMDFDELTKVVGFEKYYSEEHKYRL